MPSKPCRYCLATWHYSSQCFYKPRTITTPCKFCQGMDHVAWQCFKNPNRHIETKAKLKNGKQARKWIGTRKQWFKENEAESYTCYLCGKYLTKEEVTLDHVKPRSNSPQLRHDMSNLKPSCGPCNLAKGSQSLDNYMKSKNSVDL